MEFLEYKSKFVGENDRIIEAHAAFVVNNGAKNPNFADWYSEEIERRLKDWQEEAYPGISFLRKGRFFSTHMVANTGYGGHVDYFERALSEVCPSQYIDIIHRVLPPQYMPRNSENNS